MNLSDLSAPAARRVSAPAPHAARRFAHIEYLRGLAAFAVLGFHSLCSHDPAQLHPLLFALRTVFIHGSLGIHVFFVLSGWCIAERIAAAHRRSENTAAYLRERALRIFPTYWAALFLAAVLIIAAAPFNGVPLSNIFPPDFTRWLIEVFLLPPAFGYGAVLVVSWTLFYELTFYAASAAALIARRRQVPSNALLLAGGALSLLVAWLPPTGFATGFGFWNHFYVGVLAWWSLHRPLGPAWFAALLASAAALAWQFFDGAVAAALTAFILALAGRHPPVLPPSFAQKLGALGAASYSLYLIHVPIISPFYNLSTRFVSPASAAFVPVWLAGLALALTAGFLFHRHVEAPLERWRRRLSVPRSST